MRDEERELLLSTIEKSGGIEKWNALLAAMRRVCRARDRGGIADFARASCRTEAGAVQFAALALLGLAMGSAEHERLGHVEH